MTVHTIVLLFMGVISIWVLRDMFNQGWYLIFGDDWTKYGNFIDHMANLFLAVVMVSLFTGYCGGIILSAVSGR